MGKNVPKPSIGQLSPRYSFILNPYTDLRLSRCPKCNQLTRMRKFALLVYIEQFGMLSLGKTCRFCPHCDLIMVHQDELESLMASIFAEQRPDVIGNDYLVIGTVDRNVWRKGLKKGQTAEEVLKHTADFKEVLDLEYEPGGWYPSTEG